MKQLIIFLAMPLLFAACGDLFEPDGTYYFDVEGEGYVYNEVTNEPISNMEVSVMTTFENKGYATQQPVWEDFTTDENGYFRVRFIRRIDRDDAILFNVIAGGYGQHMTTDSKSYAVDFVKKQKKNIQVEILYIKPLPYIKSNNYEYNK
jgi:hypothetical protein